MSKFEILRKFNLLIFNFSSRLLIVYRGIRLIRMKKILRKNVHIKTYKNSKIVNIIALGPSLNNEDLTKLEGDTIVVNRFDQVKTDIVPTYYLLYDSYFFGDDFKENLEAIIKKYNTSAFILNGNYYNQKLASIQRLFYFLAWGPTKMRKRLISFNNIIPAFNNVIHISILLAISLEYSEINLYGLDYNLFCLKSNVHCYDGAIDTEKPPLAFDLFNYSFTTQFHYNLADYAKKRGIIITNRSEESVLDAYKNN